MNFKLKLLGTILAGALGGAGCTISMSDDKIFNPPKWKEKASTQEELKFVDEDLLTSQWTKELEAPLVEGHLPADIKHGFVEVADYRIAYSVVKSSKSESDNSRPLILSCYGSAGDRPNLGVYYAKKLLPWGDVFEFDYPGYGDSTGTPSVDSVKAISSDIVSLANQLAGDRPLIFWGHSLGGFICPEMAALSEKLDGFVYETSALSAEEAAKEWKPWFLRIFPFIKMEPSTTPRDGDNATPLKGKDIPVLVLAGSKDKVLPAWLSRSLADALENQGNDTTYLEFENGTHINIPLEDDFAARAGPFFDKIQTQFEAKKQN